MKIQIVFVLMFALYGCASLQNPEETNIAVSALLDEIQEPDTVQSRFP